VVGCNLTSGSRYIRETEAELNATKAVLAIWSKASVESHWVADEAVVGRDENRRPNAAGTARPANSC
jgi:hypothetical protein